MQKPPNLATTEVHNTTSALENNLLTDCISIRKLEKQMTTNYYSGNRDSEMQANLYIGWENLQTSMVLLLLQMVIFMWVAFFCLWVPA